MRTRRLLLILGTALWLLPLSAIGEWRQEMATANPILIESQIRDVALDGDTVVIHLQRQPYDILADRRQRVQALDGRCMVAEDLEAGDNIHMEGDLDHNVIYARHITLQLRVEHRTGF